MSSHPLPHAITAKIPMIRISVSKWARVRCTRGSSISLKSAMHLLCYRALRWAHSTGNQFYAVNEQSLSLMP